MLFGQGTEFRMLGQGTDFRMLNLTVHRQIVTLKMVNFKERMRSSEAMSGIAVQVQSLKAQCRFCEGFPHDCVLSHMNPFHAFTAHFCKIML